MGTRHFFRLVLGLAAALAIAACSGSGSGGEGLKAYRLNGVEYGLLVPGTLTPSESGVSGDGTIIFRNPLVEEDNNFALQFTLEAGGSIDLLPNAPSDLNTPVALSFRRASDDSLKLVLKDGGAEVDLTEDLTQSVSADTPLSVEVDVHGHGDLIVWIDGMEEQWNFNSEVTGVYWGLRLNKATLSSAKADHAKEEH